MSAVPQDILSEESKGRSAKDGPCLTIAEVPRLDADSGKVFFEKTMVFHQPIIHSRMSTQVQNMDTFFPTSYNREKVKKR